MPSPKEKTLCPSHNKYVSYPLIRPNKLVQRRFQETIFMSATKKNTLVVIPTGLGKTIIGLLLTAFRLSELPSSQILILSPTRPLAEQHLNTFRELIMVSHDKLVLLTGTTPPRERYQKWRKGKIFFATPQVVENDLITGRLDMSNISLIIFDEAHRAVGNYSYAFVAQEYLKRAKHPHILGLTASPGSDKEKIEEVCKNLNIEHTEIRTDLSEDVRPYIQQTNIEWRHIILPPKFLGIKRHLDALYSRQIQVLRDTGVLDQNIMFQYKKKKRPFLSRRMLIELQGHIQSEISQYSEPHSRLFSAITATANAIRLSHALELLETQGLRSLADYLQRTVAKAKHTGAPKSLRKLTIEPRFISAYQATIELLKEGFEHPKIEEIISIIKEQLERQLESRVIVFTQYRDSAGLLVEKLKAIPHVVPVRFVGQANRDSDKGLSQKKQSEILEQFRDGLYNVLVATQVAEEGLDIASCDLVIFYDSVPSGVRFIQRRGRTGRQTRGRVVILIAKGTRDEAYYWSAIRKEKAMKAILRSGEFIKDQITGDDVSNRQLSLDKFTVKDEKVAAEVDSPHEIRVIVDHRETGSEVVRELVRMRVKIDTQSLPAGDYVVSDRTVIERKGKEDFIKSIFDKRLFKQCISLKKTYSNPIILVEGDPLTSGHALKANAVRGAIASILIDFQIPVFTVKSPTDTANMIYAFARREQAAQQRIPRVRGEAAPLSLQEIQEYVVSGLPGVDRKLAERLLEHFSSIKAIFSSSTQELMQVKGIGKIKAERINEAINAPYRKEENRSIERKNDDT
ncbi:MAG: DEAD/DEAH box helicase [Candidatus Ranarchaeia archaeon]